MAAIHEQAFARAQVQQAALFRLLKDGIPTMGPGAAWRALTEAAAETLGARRVSIWLFDEECTRLALVDGFDAASGVHHADVAIESAGYPAYFGALATQRVIMAPDALTDPRTREFAAGYLSRFRIVSMLDAGIWLNGEARGAVCIESVDERRTWTLDEQQFAGSIADLAASVLSHDHLAHALAQLEESEALFANALRSSPDWISVVALDDGEILHVNDAFERESGYSREGVVGQRTLEIGLWLRPEDRQAYIDHLRTHGMVRDYEVRFRKKNGDIRIFHLSGNRVRIRGRDCVVTISRDVTDQQRQQDLVRAIAQGVGERVGESFFRSLVDTLAGMLGAQMVFIGEVTTNDTVRTIAVNRDGRAGENFEYPLDGSPCATIIGHAVCTYPDGVAELYPRDRGLAKMGARAYVGAPLSDSAGKPLGLIAVLFRQPLRDVTLPENVLRIFAARAGAELERQLHFRAMHHIAHHDALTGLPNRRRLRQRIDEAIAARRESDPPSALLLIDLDRFKEVNDTLGHHVGDQLLTLVAGRLAREAQALGADVARLGGDEFAVWLQATGPGREASRVADVLLEALVAPLDIDGLTLELGASIGIAMAPQHARTASGLMRCADVALYAAKRSIQGHLEYDAALDPYSHDRLMLLSQLREAVRQGQIVAHYQPRVTLSDGRVAGFEALARWEHPRHGLMPPSRFIPLAELSDVIRPLTLSMLDQALAAQREWARDRVFSVNISGRHLLDEHCPDQVHEALAKRHSDPAGLELEITESALISDPERARHVLERLATMGVHISVDDFGTGYSSLSHLKRLPLHALKIDSSFVKPMLGSAADGAIVASTVALSRNLGLHVVAEGIEDAATFAALRQMGCDEGQGYHIARPLPGAQARSFLAGGL